MPKAIECVHMNHINFVIEDYDKSVDQLTNLYGAQFNLDLPGDHWHACLISVGGVMFELFAPTVYLLHARMGPHYVGVEYQVLPDVDTVRAEVLERGMRVIRELNVAIHVHPAEAFGVAWEFFGRSFHDREDPPVPYPEPIWTAERFGEHPIGYTGLKRYSVVVSDLDAAVEFAEGFLGGNVIYREDRPAIAAQAVGFSLGDTVVELLTPTGAGPIETFWARYGDGIRSTVFAVRDLEKTKQYFAEQGVALHPGDAPGSVAVAPEDNMGLLFEFSE
jgi:catechol 2,3-dioxygenase-like lactoylglutathione lyase family enzyme